MINYGFVKQPFTLFDLFNYPLNKEVALFIYFVKE